TSPLVERTDKGKPIFGQWLLRNLVSSLAQSFTDLGQSLRTRATHVVSFRAVSAELPGDTRGGRRKDLRATDAQAREFDFVTHHPRRAVGRRLPPARLPSGEIAGVCGEIAN